MGQVRFSVAVSLDGYMAGPEQSLDDPLGKGGMQLHQWAFKARRGEEPVSAAILDEATENVGAYILGRNMFGGGRGDWGDGSWKGWWGDEPPYHAPVFVVTHHAREPLPMEGGTTFHFVTDGIESALKQAQAAAGDRAVSIAGGATTVRQYLAAGLLDELLVHVVPVVLGDGERLWDGLGGLAAEPTEVIASPTVTHVRYRINPTG